MGRGRGPWPRGFLREAPFVVLGLTGAIAPALTAQEPSTVRYDAAQLTCAVARQVVRSEVETLRGEIHRVETVGWDGELVLDVRAGPGEALALTAWFRSLRVWRVTPEGRWEPSAAGMIGGRYRGTLDPSGAFVRTAAPFVPDAVATLAALETAVDELLPPTPRSLPAVGDSATAGDAWRIERLTDTTWAGRTAWRFRLRRSDTTAVTVAWADSVTAEGESIEVEEGRLVWGPQAGPLRWVRRIETDVRFPESAVTASAVRTAVRQERVFERLAPAVDACQAP